MNPLTIVVYTMKGCPFCEQFKEILNQESIPFIDRDIHEHEEEYNLFSEVTKNDMIPALMLIEGESPNHKSYLYVPERDYNELNEAVDLIRKHTNQTKQ